MADNNVLFATLRAFISSRPECAESILRMTATITHFKRRLNLIQFVESHSSRQRRIKCLLLNHFKENFGVRPALKCAWWDNVQAGPAIVLDIATTKSRRAAKSCTSHILDPVAYGFGNARVSSRKLCAGIAKIWLFGPHSACSLIQPKLFASFISTSSRKSCAASVLELKKFS